MTADIKKKKKSDVPSAEMPESPEMMKAKMMGASAVPGIKSAAPQSGMIKAILDKELGKKDVNAVTEVEGEVIEWKAGQNPRKEEIEIKKKYQDKLKKLRGK